MTAYKKIELLMTKCELSYLPKLIIIMIISMFLESFTVGFILPAIGVMMNRSFLETVPILKNIDFLKSLPQIRLICLGMSALVFVYIVKTIFMVYALRYQYELIYRTKIKLSSRLFAGYLRQPWAFHLQRNSSKLMQNIMNETNLFVGNVLSPAITFVSELLIMFGALILLLIIKPTETLYVIAFFISVSFFYYFTTKNLSLKWGRDRFVSDAKCMLQLQQGLSCIKEVKLLAKEEYFSTMYNKHSKISADVSRKYQVFLNIPKLLLELVAIIGLAILVVLLIQHEPIENILPIVALFAAVAFRLIPSVNRIVTSLSNLRFSREIINNLYNELLLISKNQQNNSNSSLAFKNKLVLKNIYFSYKGSKDYTLKNINVTICQGTSVGVIGPSGAGKSTLIDLILGLIKPSHGSIKVDNIEISDNLSTWQKQIGYIPQTIHLLDDTIKKNVAFGLFESEIDDAKVRRALKLAELYELIDGLPQKINTHIGENGVRLSGGQRQRLGIARALYNDPKVLVLDEATSSLDIETENQIMKTFYGLYGLKTLFIITHRISTIKNCDVVYKISNGEILEDKTVPHKYKEPLTE